MRVVACMLLWFSIFTDSMYEFPMLYRIIGCFDLAAGILSID